MHPTLVAATLRVVKEFARAATPSESGCTQSRRLPSLRVPRRGAVWRQRHESFRLR